MRSTAVQTNPFCDRNKKTYCELLGSTGIAPHQAVVLDSDVAQQQVVVPGQTPCGATSV